MIERSIPTYLKNTYNFFLEIFYIFRLFENFIMELTTFNERFTLSEKIWWNCSSSVGPTGAGQRQHPGGCGRQPGIRAADRERLLGGTPRWRQRRRRRQRSGCYGAQRLDCACWRGYDSERRWTCRPNDDWTTTGCSLCHTPRLTDRPAGHVTTSLCSPSGLTANYGRRDRTDVPSYERSTFRYHSVKSMRCTTERPRLIEPAPVGPHYTLSQKKLSRFVFVRTASNFHRFW